MLDQVGRRAGIPVSSLRIRLAALIVSALLPSMALLVFTQYRTHETLRLEVQQLAVSSARGAAREVESILTGVESVLTSILHTNLVDTGEECGRVLRDLQAALPHLNGLVVLDGEARVRCASVPVARGASYAHRPHIQEALARPGLSIGLYTRGSISDQPLLPLARARRTEDGNSRIAMAALDLKWLGEEMRRRGVPPGGSLTLADRNGTIIVREPLPDRFIGTRIPDAFLRLVAARQAGFEEVTSQDGTRRILGYVPAALASGVYVSAGLSTEASYGALSSATRWQLSLAAAVVLFSIILGWLVGSRIFVRPILQLTEAARSWGDGKRSDTLPEFAGSGEIAELGREMRTMFAKISEHETQRELAAGELAHRIKNLWATVYAIAQSTLRKPQPAQDLLPDFLARLTALSRAHDVLTGAEVQTAQMGAIAAMTVETAVADAASRVRIEGPALTLTRDQAIGMTMVLHELCTNALKYGALSLPAGKVELGWDLTGPDRRILQLDWRESGGPPMDQTAQRPGFGTRLVHRALGNRASVTLEHPSSGTVCRIVMELESS